MLLFNIFVVPSYYVACCCDLDCVGSIVMVVITCANNCSLSPILWLKGQRAYSIINMVIICEQILDGYYGVWILWSVDIMEYGYYGVWILWSMDIMECGDRWTLRMDVYSM